MKKNQRRIISIFTALLIGFTMFSIANATTPEENKIAGTKFLAENAKKAKEEKIIITASGLQYQVITAGKGASPKATDSVTVHYKGTHLDGSVFDSSSAPITFPLDRVIKGWTEGVQLMKEGAKYRFFIPAELAYGAQGAGNAIAPNEALIFEVELIKVN